MFIELTIDDFLSGLYNSICNMAVLDTVIAGGNTQTVCSSKYICMCLAFGRYEFVASHLK